MLLSFAQFEREVTGERIRDKIAASKRKGMRMGGPVPLGYEVRAKKLVVNDEEAQRVRSIFARYLELGSLDLLLRDLHQRGILTKISRRKDGTTRGGILFGKGSLAYLLKNRVYLGEVIHKGRHFAGEHDPIVAPELFEAVTKKLAAGARVPQKPRVASGAILMGRIYDERGHRMTPAHAPREGFATATTSRARLQQARGPAHGAASPRRSWSRPSSLSCATSSGCAPGRSRRAKGRANRHRTAFSSSAGSIASWSVGGRPRSGWPRAKLGKMSPHLP